MHCCGRGLRKGLWFLHRGTQPTGEEASSGPQSPPVLPNPAGSQRPQKPVLQAETVVKCDARGLANKVGCCLLSLSMVGWPNTLGFQRGAQQAPRFWRDCVGLMHPWRAGNPLVYNICIQIHTHDLGIVSPSHKKHRHVIKR